MKAEYTCHTSGDVTEHQFYFKRGTLDVYNVVCPWVVANIGPDAKNEVWIRSGPWIVIFDDDAALAFRMRWC